MTTAIANDLDSQVKAYNDRYREDPNRWIKEVMRVDLWSKQRDIIDSVFQNRKTVVRSCFGPGKTFTAACAALVFMNIRGPAKVATTAPTWRHVKNVLWAEINHLWETKLYDRCPGEMWTTRYVIRPDWVAEGVSSKDPSNVQGIHQKNMLVIVDEVQGVDPQILEAIDSLTATGDAHILWIGNPTDASGPFFNAFRDGSWTPFQIDYIDTPNFTGEDVPQDVKDKLITEEWVEEKREKWGENSPLFQSRCRGNFPEAGERQVIGLGLCEMAMVREVIPEGDRFLGVDVARFGDDLTVYAKRRGNVITEIITESSRDTMEIAGKIMAMHHQEAFREIIVDEIGIGAGVVDRLKEQGAPVRGLNVAAKSSDDMYFNKRSEVWFNMADWLKYGSIPKDYELMADLTAPQYRYESNGKYRVEKKDETKKRLGRSPDRADAVILAVQATAGGRIGMW